MLSKKTEEVLNRAGMFALRHMHEYVTVEHVLYSLLEESTIWDLIIALNGDFEGIKKTIEKYLLEEVPKARKIKDENLGKKDEELVEPPAATLGLQRLVQRAIFQVQSAGKSEVRPEDLFVALFQAKDSVALHTLEKYGIEKLAVIEYLSHGRNLSDLPTENQDNTQNDNEDEENNSNTKFQNNILSHYTIALHELAKENKIDPLIGREKELERVIQTLCRRRKNNPLLVGEAGVGKTAIAEGLALKIKEGNVPDLLKNAEIYSLDIGALLAGTKFRGDFESRLKKVLSALKKRKESGHFVILFIDEIHNIVGAGSVSGSSIDAANLLKPYLSKGELHCIGSTTYQEYRNIFEKDSALSRRFQKIDIVEPSVEDSIKILEGLKSKFEEHHKIEIQQKAIKAAVELSAKHITDRWLPDKAIDVLDEACARARIKGHKKVTVSDIESMIAQIARIPERSVSVDQKTRLKNLDRDLKLVIFGQDHAIDQVTQAIKLASSGLRTGERPIGSFLFCGPTGVGKTELAKQVALLLGIPFLRFDMSEYMEKHTVSRLIGAPPGYVGFEQAGLLTDAVRKNPHAVVLLDEIEKAHFDVLNLLLQIMDYGFLTDNNGKKTDFRNVILIMTTNVGAREYDRTPLGIIDSSMEQKNTKSNPAKKEVERTFTPEFRNRLDAIIYFNPLDPITIAQIVGKQLYELENLLLSKGIEIEFSEDLREWLSKKGYDKQMGARPMARLIQDKIKRPLSEEILFGELQNGGKVFVTIENDEPVFKYESKKLKHEKKPLLEKK
jgi:ATP-dependent Clp protease ATP-binding subunit ClpA